MVEAEFIFLDQCDHYVEICDSVEWFTFSDAHSENLKLQLLLGLQ